ncbi:MAG: NAD(P)H-binding protein, partial [Thermoanaerobaculia bacterium]
MKILVTGATGYIGSRLVPELLAQGHAVRCLARDAAKLGARGWQGTEVVAGDVLAPETLPAALAGIEVAYYLVHSMNGDGADFAQRDRAAARNFAEAAAAQGVSRIVYLGGLGDGAALSEHLTSRQETGDVLRRSGVPVTELRAAIIVGSGSASFEIIRDLARKLPFMICPRWVSSRCEPIAVRDVLAYLTGVLAEPRTVGRTFEIGGGETYTYADLMRICADVMGRRVRILTVPFLTPRLSAYWLNLVTAVPMSIARPLVEGLRNDVVTRDRSIRDLIRLDLVKFREAVALSLAREGRAGLPSRWTGASTAASARPWPERAPLLSDTRTVVSPSGAAEVFARVRR